MKTIVKKVNKKKIEYEIIKEAATILKSGGLVAFPTETVYGLGADALNPEASKKIYQAKGRPSDNPLIVHIASMEDLAQIVTEIPHKAKQLGEAFWPGPLTMIFQKNQRIPLETTGGLSSVAVRMPQHPVALAVIAESSGFIAAPSANTSGKPSPTLAEHVWQDMEGKIPMILDGGAVGIGIESTIVDFTEEIPTILRPGYISLEMIEQVIGRVQMDPGLVAVSADTKPKAPGMKYRHYAPKAELILVQGEQEQVIKEINRLVEQASGQGKKPGVIGTEETCCCYGQGMVKSIGSRKEEETIARHLYKILREFDEENVDIIYSESFENGKMGEAIMNRLRKAAGYHIIEV